MKKNKIILFFFVSFFMTITKISAQELVIQSEHAILYNRNTNEVLYEKNSEEKTAVASLTKIMTAIVTIENVKSLDKKITMESQDFKGLIDANASVAGFRVGDQATYRDLLYGLLLPSGADAALALSRTVAGSQKKMVALMNEKAKEMHLKSTHFSNVTGLDDDQNYSTAKEVAEIFKYALQNKDLYAMFTAEKYTMSNRRFSVISTLYKMKIPMPFLVGGKTGTTDDAGLCLASIASGDDVNFLLITTGAPYDKKGAHNFEDAKNIYEYFIDNYSNQIIIKRTDPILKLKTKYGKEEYVTFYLEEDLISYLPNNIDRSFIHFDYEGEEVITPEIKAGTNLGDLKIFYDDKELKTVSIILKESIQKDWMKYIFSHKELLLLPTSIIILLSLIILKKKNKH